MRRPISSDGMRPARASVLSHRTGNRSRCASCLVVQRSSLMPPSMTRGECATRVCRRALSFFSGEMSLCVPFVAPSTIMASHAGCSRKTWRRAWLSDTSACVSTVASPTSGVPDSHACHSISMHFAWFAEKSYEVPNQTTDLKSGEWRASSDRGADPGHSAHLQSKPPGGQGQSCAAAAVCGGGCIQNSVAGGRSASVIAETEFPWSPLWAGHREHRTSWLGGPNREGQAVTSGEMWSTVRAVTTATGILQRWGKPV